MPRDEALGGAPGAHRYDLVTRMLHWGVAAAIIFQWFGAHAIDHFSPGMERVAARSVHILIGAVLAGVLGLRIWWRAERGVRFAPDRCKTLATIAQLTHVSLYGLLITALGLGLLNTWVRGDSIFSWFHIPALGDFSPSARHAFANQLVVYHRLAANLILALAAVHAAAALIHHFFFRDTVLKRMAPISGWRLR